MAHIDGGTREKQLLDALRLALATRPVERRKARLRDLLGHGGALGALRRNGVDVGLGGEKQLQDAPLTKSRCAAERGQTIVERSVDDVFALCEDGRHGFWVAGRQGDLELGARHRALTADVSMCPGARALKFSGLLFIIATVCNGESG